MHPFMPFITEELWQRLPRQKGGAPTIMLAPYPEYDTGLDFHVDALNYELGLRCVSVMTVLFTVKAVDVNY